MAQMKIYCSYCKQHWYVYQSHSNWKHEAARCCPHCFHKIDHQTWDNLILPAFGAFMDLNQQLIKDTGGGSVRFVVDFEEDYYFPDTST